MRLLAIQPDEQLAVRFRNYLESQQISSRVDREADGFHIWVIQEDDLDGAKAAYAEFLVDPKCERFTAADSLAASLKSRREQAADKKKSRRRQVRLPWQSQEQRDFPITILLIVISVTVSFLTEFGKSDNRLRSSLMISNVQVFNRQFNESGEVISERLVKKLPEVTEQGQVWRVATPMFLHFSPMHLVFNMIMTFQLGSFMERRKGSLFLLVRVLLVAVGSNLLQFYFEGPFFGGMSGVVYGMFGYLWMKGVLSPEDGMGLDQQTVFVMLAWIVMCFFMGGVANYAHAGGLFLGMILGAAPGLVGKKR